MTRVGFAVLSGRFAAQDGIVASAVEITRMDHTAAKLHVLAAKSRDSAQSRRLLAIAMVLEGTSREDAARKAGIDRLTLRGWLHRYNKIGPDGLISRTAPGLQPRLKKAKLETFRDLVIAGTDVAIHGVVRGRCVDLRDEVARRFGVTVGEGTIASWLRRFGLTRPQPRPVHPKKDPAAEEAFEKILFSAKRSLGWYGNWQAGGDLVSRRSMRWPAGHASLFMCTDRLAASDGARQPPLLRL